MLSPGQTARRLGVSREWVVQLANEGRLPHIRTPLGRLFPEGVVENYAEGRRKSLASRTQSGSPA
jgi:excisionase family DNA binding protein